MRGKEGRREGQLFKDIDLGIFTADGQRQESSSTMNALSSYGPGELGVECVRRGGEMSTQQRTQRLQRARDKLRRCSARGVAPSGGGQEACLVAGLG